MVNCQMTVLQDGDYSWDNMDQNMSTLQEIIT
jgi:hypothetical protein